jgi:hypothetical protein
VSCDRCDGRGRTEGLIACAKCKTLGAVACDFCGGSGLAGFDFFPQPVWHAVARVRSRLASRRLEAVLAAPPARGGAVALSDVLTRRYATVARWRAVLLGLPDPPRSPDGLDHADVTHAVSEPVARLLAKADLDIAQTLAALATAVRKAVPVPHDDDRQAYQKARADVLQEWAADLSRAAPSKPS